MNNYIFKINGENTLFHRSTRKIIWFSLPSLKPIHKYYTKSSFINLNEQGNIIIADEGSVSFATIKLPPLTICEYSKQFIQYNPIGGFRLSHSLVLFQKHSIVFFSVFPTFSKTDTIQVMQEMVDVKPSYQEDVLGVMVKQKKNTIFIWDMGEFSSKPKQQIDVADQIIKWQFYLKQMLIILTKNHLRVFYPKDGHYNIQFYCQMPQNSIDFCLLDRPKTHEHSGRRTVYPIAVLTNNRRLYIYELYDVDKRVKTSVTKLLADFQVQQNIYKVISGYQKDNQVIFVFQNINKKPVVYRTDNKFKIKNKEYYLPEICDNIQSLDYRKSFILIQQKLAQQKDSLQKIWKVYEHKNRDQTNLISGFESKQAVLGNKRLFLFHQKTVTYYGKQTKFTKIQNQIQFKAPPNIRLLEEQQNCAFFISGIKIYKIDFKELQIKAIGFTVRNQRFKLIDVRTHTRSLLYLVNNQYYLMEYQLHNHKIIAKNIRASANKMISLRNGKWLQLNNVSITVGVNNRKLTCFDLMKFFKNISSQNNSLYDYKVYWTTHDGILLIAKNYLFVFQLIQDAQGYHLCLIKRMLTYLHHRFSPDCQILEVLDPRQIVVRQGNRVIKIGSKLGTYISQDPFSLPDTLLNRQLSMRKHYPPHHPKIIQYLIELGCFSHLQKLINTLYKWFTSNKHINWLYESLNCQFFNKYQEQDDERIIVSKMQQDQLTEIQKMKDLCQKILQNPYRLQLQQNNGLILQNQIQSLIFKQQNSRSMDYFSSIPIIQNRIESVKNKNKGFDTMQVAYLLHSINKDEAITILKPQKIDWNWLKKYSIILWYDNQQQIKKWIQEIAGHQYRKDKDPFDCLLWYTIAGKKNILTTLFKNHKFNSKEHAGVLAFLQKDFNDPKTLSAAGKNAYALHDKKRYHHSIAFFLLGQQIQQAINMCINKLKDLNMAYLLCKIYNRPIDRIIKTLNEDGDIWCRHIAHFYQASHIDSFNCLFQDEDFQSLQKWDLQLRLTKFHPCLKLFAQMIQKSIPVRRELQEQKMKKQAKTQSMDIFESFYGQSNSENQNDEVQFEQKVLQPNYQKISQMSAKFFLQDQCPELALMIDHHNYKAQRAYDLTRFMISKKIKPTVLEIAEQMQDTVSLICSNLQNKHSIFGLVQHHYNKTLESYKKIRLNDLMEKDKNTIGQVLHFCYLTDQIVKKQKQILQKQISGECILFLQEKLKNIEMYGRLLIVLQLSQYTFLQTIIQQLLLFSEKKMYSKASQEFWTNIKISYDKLPEFKKNKSLQILDEFQQAFYKFSFVKNKAQTPNYEFQLQIQRGWQIYIKRALLILIQPLFSHQSDIKQHIKTLISLLNTILTVWVQQSNLTLLNNQISLLFIEGPSSKLKLNYLPDLMSDDFEGIAKILYLLKHRHNNIPLPLVKISAKSREKHAQKHKQALQIFKNKSQGMQSFTINKNQGQGLQVALLFKRGMKKLEVCESLINRNRSHDGLFLVHEDTPYNIQHSINFDTIFQKQKSYPPLIQETLHNIIDNRNQYDGKGILKGSTKRGSEDYFKQIQNIPIIDFNQAFTIKCHHFLPIFLLGGKGYIDLCHFNQLKNYNRIKCPGMTDIVKICSFQQRITALDHHGNLGSFSLDHRLTGNCVFDIKKAGIVDFCIMSPTIYCYATNNSVQVVDSLLHPKRQCVFKLSLNQQPSCIDSLMQTKILISRKNDLQIYDFRMDMQQSTRQISSNSNVSSSNLAHSKIKCMASDHKNKILVGKQDGKIRVVDYNDADNDYDIKCSKGLDQVSQNRQAKGLGIQELQIMGNTAIVRTTEGGLYLIDRID